MHTCFSQPSVFMLKLVRPGAFFILRKSQQTTWFWLKAPVKMCTMWFHRGTLTAVLMCSGLFFYPEVLAYLLERLLHCRNAKESSDVLTCLCEVSTDLQGIFCCVSHVNAIWRIYIYIVYVVNINIFCNNECKNISTYLACANGIWMIYTHTHTHVPTPPTGRWHINSTSLMVWQQTFKKLCNVLFYIIYIYNVK